MSINDKCLSLGEIESVCFGLFDKALTGFNQKYFGKDNATSRDLYDMGFRPTSRGQKRDYMFAYRKQGM
ncbi:MAG: hypothetical protein JW791_03290 [Nanoarchaeota archaeon]|nr:hypothetical protein [Nanoarchaeota archaeon]